MYIIALIQPNNVELEDAIHFSLSIASFVAAMEIKKFIYVGNQSLLNHPRPHHLTGKIIPVKLRNITYGGIFFIKQNSSKGSRFAQLALEDHKIMWGSRGGTRGNNFRYSIITVVKCILLFARNCRKYNWKKSLC